MTREEQIEEMRRNIYYARSKVNGIATSNDIAEALYSICYRKVPDGAVVLTPEERDEEMKATNEILAERDELIAKVGILGRENYDLKAENKQLKTECALLDNELRIARQDTIDALNKVKEKLNNTPNGWAYTTYIDELIKEYE